MTTFLHNLTNTTSLSQPRRESEPQEGKRKNGERVAENEQEITHRGRNFRLRGLIVKSQD